MSGNYQARVSSVWEKPRASTKPTDPSPITYPMLTATFLGIPEMLVSENVGFVQNLTAISQVCLSIVLCILILNSESIYSAGAIFISAYQRKLSYSPKQIINKSSLSPSADSLTEEKRLEQIHSLLWLCSRQNCQAVNPSKNYIDQIKWHRTFKL